MTSIMELSMMTHSTKTVIMAFSIMTHSIITRKMIHGLMVQHYNKHNGTQYDDTQDYNNNQNDQSEHSV
jgi:hypothetical protein